MIKTLTSSTLPHSLAQDPIDPRRMVKVYHPPPQRRFEAYMYIDDACKKATQQRTDNHIESNAIRQQIERIYNSQGIPLKMYILTDRDDAKDMYTIWQQGRMPPNIQVFQVTHDTKNYSDEEEAGCYSHYYRIHYVNFYRLLHNFPFLETGEGAVNRSYQVAHTAAHEMLHNMLHTIQHYYGISDKWDRAFNIDETDHSREDERWGPNLNTCGNIPQLYDARDERILPEQLYAVKTLLSDIYNNDADLELSGKKILQNARKEIKVRK